MTYLTCQLGCPTSILSSKGLLINSSKPHLGHYRTNSHAEGLKVAQFPCPLPISCGKACLGQCVWTYNVYIHQYSNLMSFPLLLSVFSDLVGTNYIFGALCSHGKCLPVPATLLICGELLGWGNEVQPLPPWRKEAISTNSLPANPQDVTGSHLSYLSTHHNFNMPKA